LDRHGAVLALGGGVIGDLAGFAAATWLRGIDVVQIPTTLLAMVDSAIGGKTGVNLPIGKNLVGAFHQPRAVLIDPNVLKSLPSRDVRSGMAEVIKYGVIADAALFAFLEAEMPRCLGMEPDAMARVIGDSAACKARVVNADEREGGLRAILNYGHTAGHAVEKAAGYRRLRHGEAIAIGMGAAAHIGHAMGITPSETVARVEAVIEAAGLPLRMPPGVPLDTLIHAMALDKKAKGGSVKWVMAEAIGRVRTGVEVPLEVAARTLRELGAE
jgi:3-dehydroquinate synthase